MRVFYAYESLPAEATCSLFLMGPTQRHAADGIASWRGEALRILDELGFTGEVFVPEPHDGKWASDDTEQIRWEDAALQRSDRIMVWLPRELTTMPGLTTNDEWGYWKGRDPARLILGTPPDAQRVHYQQYYAKQFNIPVYSTLRDTCQAAASDRGEPRRGGECQVPLHLWRTEAFQSWYAAQKQAGNELCGARVEWVFRIGLKRVFAWALHVDMYVAAEYRHKTNEVILSRPDIAAVVLYRRGRDLMDTEVVLVREYRSTSSTPDGYIWELPSGSTNNEGHTPELIAVTEVEEELGLSIDPQVLQRHGTRQLAGTLSTHKAHVYSAELTEDQRSLLHARELSGTWHGDVTQSEQTAVRICKVREILTAPYADWSTIGIILGVLQLHAHADISRQTMQ